MKTQQEWVKDILFSIISLMKKNQYNGNINDEGYRYTINGALDNYSQTYWDREKGKNIVYIISIINLMNIFIEMFL